MAKAEYFPIFDYFRIAAIFLVVLVHTQNSLIEDQFVWQNWYLYSVFFIGKLGVPLFVMVSGALLLQKEDENIQFYQKRLQRILLPWMFWSTLLFAVYTSQQSFSPFSVSALIKQWLIVFLSNYWFMPMIIGLYALTPLLKNGIQRIPNLLYLIVPWFAFCSIMPALFFGQFFHGTSSSGLITLLISFAGYYLLGLWLWQQKNTDLHPGWLVTSSVVSLVYYLLQASWTTSEPNHLFFSLQDYLSPPLVIGSASVFLLGIKSRLPQLLQLPNKRLKLAGIMTYGVFLSHILIIAVLNLADPAILQFFWSSTSVISWIVRAILIYVLSFILIDRLRKIPKVQQIVT